MELKSGYKQTEVGVIPSDWEVKVISTISRVVRGGSPRPAGSPKYFNGDFIPWLTVASLTNIPDSKIRVETTESCLTKEGSHFSRTLDKGTLIIANSGATLGIAKILDIRCCANDGVAALLEVDKNVDKVFVVYLINSLTKTLRESVATGNGQPNLNTELIGNITIPLPPTIAEQTAIATALSDTDQYITHLEKLIAKKRNIKQGAMQELLKPKEGWMVKQIQDFTDVSTGGTPSTLIKEYWGGEIRWMNSSELNLKKVHEVENRITEYGLKNSATRLIPENCILIGLAGQGKTRGTVAINKIELCTNQSIAAILPCQTVDFNFLYFNLDSRYDELRGLSTGDGGRGGLNLTIIKRLPICLPPKKSEQTRIATILSDMDTEIATLETKLSKAQSIKQGMMQQLLTGKIRLV